MVRYYIGDILARYITKINDWFMVSNSSTMFNLFRRTIRTDEPCENEGVETTKQLPVDRLMIRRHRFRAKSGQKHCQEDFSNTILVRYHCNLRFFKATTIPRPHPKSHPFVFVCIF